MEDRQHASPVDIAEEQYSGPSAVIVALGRGAIQHLKWAGYGLGAGFLIGGVFSKPTTEFIESIRDISARNLTTEKGILKALRNETAEIGLKIFGEGKHIKLEEFRTLNDRHQDWLNELTISKQNGFGHWLLAHTVGIIPFVEKPVHYLLEWSNRHERARNALTLGGILGSAGYVSGWVEAIFTGKKYGNSARDQLQRAQDALKKEYTTSDALAAQNTRLAEENAVLRTQLAQASAGMAAANDNPAQAPEPHAAGQAAAREPIKTPEQDWVSEIAAKNEAAAQQEAARG